MVFARLPVAPKAKVEAANPATGGKNPCRTLAKAGKPFEANLLICWELVKGEVLAALVRTLGGGQAVVHHAPVGHGRGAGERSSSLGDTEAAEEDPS